MHRTCHVQPISFPTITALSALSSRLARRWDFSVNLIKNNKLDNNNPRIGAQGAGLEHTVLAKTRTPVRGNRPNGGRLGWLACVVLFLLAHGCGYEHMQGRSMGTTYAVQASCALPQQHIRATLARVNRQMSTYDADSELSIFNRAGVGEPIAVSPELVEVVAAAHTLSERTGGAFDATVAPLVALWGFGAQAATTPPTAAQVQAARANVGHYKVSFTRRPPLLVKRAPVTLDLSAIAKGHAVDTLAQLLQAEGCNAFLIELGGEIRTAGPAPGGGRWRIAIESPDSEHPLTTLQLREGAVATSGDYRQRRIVDGAAVSHIIDPRTGRPARHQTRSVTVVAGTAREADGLATGLLVMGAHDGTPFAEQHGVAALFVIQHERGFVIRESPAMAKYR